MEIVLLTLFIVFYFVPFVICVYYTISYKILTFLGIGIIPILNFYFLGWFYIMKTGMKWATVKKWLANRFVDNLTTGVGYTIFAAEEMESVDFNILGIRNGLNF